MTPRERVLTATRHQQPDRVPFFYRDIPEVEQRLLKELHLDDREELLRHLDIDFRWVEPTYIGPSLGDPEDGITYDIWGVEFRYKIFHENDGYWEVYGPPLAECERVSEIERYQWPSIEWFDFSTLKKQVQQYEQFAIMTAPGYASPSILLTIQNLMGIERAWSDIIIRQDLIRAMIDHIIGFQTAYVEKMLEAAEGRIDFFRIGDDFGGQRSLLMKPELWRELFQPALMKLAHIAKSHGAYYYHHSCGSIRPLIPDLIDTGVDVLDPVQVKAQGMVPAELKAEFGDRLCFSGGVDEQQLLPKGSPAQVRKAVHDLLDDMAQGGGFFIGPTHNFQVDIPIKNILAMYEAAAEWKS